MEFDSCFCYFVGFRKEEKSSQLFLCRVCDQAMTTEGELKSHYRTQHHIATVCQCGRYFKSDHAYRYHYKVKHKAGRSLHKCDVCGLTSEYFHSMKRHMTTHTDWKPFRCNICNKCFYRKDSLQNHWRTRHLGRDSKWYWRDYVLKCWVKIFQWFFIDENLIVSPQQPTWLHFNDHVKKMSIKVIWKIYLTLIVTNPRNVQ